MNENDDPKKSFKRTDFMHPYGSHECGLDEYTRSYMEKNMMSYEEAIGYMSDKICECFYQYGIKTLVENDGYFYNIDVCGKRFFYMVGALRKMTFEYDGGGLGLDNPIWKSFTENRKFSFGKKKHVFDHFFYVEDSCGNIVTIMFGDSNDTSLVVDIRESMHGTVDPAFALWNLNAPSLFSLHRNEWYRINPFFVDPETDVLGDENVIPVEVDSPEDIEMIKSIGNVFDTIMTEVYGISDIRLSEPVIMNKLADGCTVLKNIDPKTLKNHEEFLFVFDLMEPSVHMFESKNGSESLQNVRFVYVYTIQSTIIDIRFMTDDGESQSYEMHSVYDIKERAIPENVFGDVHRIFKSKIDSVKNFDENIKKWSNAYEVEHGNEMVHTLLEVLEPSEFENASTNMKKIDFSNFPWQRWEIEESKKTLKLDETWKLAAFERNHAGGKYTRVVFKKKNIIGKTKEITAVFKNPGSISMYPMGFELVVSEKN